MPILEYIPFSNLSTSFESAICLGNFDGVHLGHRTLVEETIKLSKSKLPHVVRACALFFSPLPADFFHNSDSAKHIMQDEDKIEYFKKLGLDGVYICDFSEIYSYSPNKFIEEVLKSKCKCKSVVCGFNYRFGYKAQGTPEFLSKSFSKDNFIMVPPVKILDTVVSSSVIRENIESGNIFIVNKFLGRPFSISHLVVHGKNIGNKIGFPTLNHQFSDNEIVPKFGIYTTCTEINGKYYKSVTNVGVCPTVSNKDTITCETHIIDCPTNCDFYGQKARVHFFERTRDEMKFNSISELSNAISNDVLNSKKYFKANTVFNGVFDNEKE